MKRTRILKFLLSRWFRETSGHVAVILALAVIPIISVAGFALDFQMTTMRKNKVQTVIDSGVLAGARAMQANKTQDQIRQIVKDYIAAQIGTFGSSFSCTDPEVIFSDGSKDIKTDILCTQKTSLMQIVGKNEMQFKVSSTSTYGIGKLDVAFMFDVSGSMANNNRMVYLKEAAQDALDTLLPAGGGVTSEDVRIAMISYNDMLNAGDLFDEVTGLSATRTYHAVNTTETQQRVPPYIEEYQNWECQSEWICTNRYTKGKNKGKCKSGYWSDANCQYVTRERDVYNYETVVTSTPVSRTITSTCVWERYGDREFSDFAPSYSADGEVTLTSPKTNIYNADKPIYNASDNPDNPQGYMAAGYTFYRDDSDSWSTSGTSCRNHKPVPLTDNRTTLSNYITGLTTGGGTAGHQGIAWAWYMVAEPWQSIFPTLSDPLDYTEPDSVKAVILMSDGEFLNRRFSSMGTSTEQARRICDAIKDNDHVVIYSVAFQAPQAGQDILDYCASGPEFSFSPQSGDELTQAYQAIATSISDLRVKY